MSLKPLFITFEGPDGSGKSTISKLFYEYLINNNIPAIWTREPGGNQIEISEEIRNIVLNSKNQNITPKTEMLLFAASRSQHVDELIRPSLKKGYFVICDRYIHSSLAYQGWGRNLGIKEVYKLNKYATDNLMPDIIFFINVPYEMGLKRITDGNRDMNRLDKESHEQHKKIYDGYLNVMKKIKSNYIIIDGTKSKEEVLNEVIEKFNKYKGK